MKSTQNIVDDLLESNDVLAHGKGEKEKNMMPRQKSKEHALRTC